MKLSLSMVEINIELFVEFLLWIQNCPIKEIEFKLESVTVIKEGNKKK